jgi:putative tricarboxylic transport membrane protein
MSTDMEKADNAARPDYAQYIVCAVMVAVGAFLVFDALSMPGGYAEVDPVGPRFFPVFIGAGLLVMAVVLAVAIPRGLRGEADAGEDIDPDMPSDWRTVGLLVGLFVLLIALVIPLGWTIASALFFGGCATVLGSKHYVRNFAIGAVLGIASFYAFYSGLGIPLPAGILDGIL